MKFRLRWIAGCLAALALASISGMVAAHAEEQHGDHAHEDGAHAHQRSAHAEAEHGGDKDADHGDEAEEAGHGDHHGHDDHDDVPKGPHGGRLLGEAAFQVEVSIFETGVEPQLRLHFYENSQPVAPGKVNAKVTLHRLGRAPEPFVFSPHGDFLLGDHTVIEPHSYEVEVEAKYASHGLSTHYESFEARVEIPEEVAAAGGVTGAIAGPRDLGRSRRLTGRVGMISDRLADLHPRFDGVVREATGSIGDRVQAGFTLAVVESSSTLARFSVHAPLTGVILDRRAVVGGSVGVGDVLYTVADLSRVWADFDVYGADTSMVRVGENVVVHEDSGADGVTATISYVSPLRDVHTQTMLARAVLANADGRWAPGAFLSGTIVIDEEAAAVAVPLSALQPWRGKDAVFVHVDGIWEARPVRLGRRGDELVEVLEGLDAGTVVATGNTFLLRAEIEKAGASHDH